MMGFRIILFRGGDIGYTRRLRRGGKFRYEILGSYLTVLPSGFGGVALEFRREPVGGGGFLEGGFF